MAETSTPQTRTVVKKDRPAKPPVWRVMEADHVAPAQPRTYLKTPSEREARQYLQSNHPRGGEAVLVHPDGFKQTFEPGRLKEDGSDHDEWLEYDPEDYE